MAQSVKCPTPGYSLGHDLTVCESEVHIEPCIGLCADSAGPACDSLSPSLSAPPLLMLSLSLSQNKSKQNLKKF